MNYSSQLLVDSLSDEEEDATLKDLTLNSYLAKNNSTDNVDFTKIMKEHEEKWKKLHYWVFE